MLELPASQCMRCLSDCQGQRWSCSSDHWIKRPSFDVYIEEGICIHCPLFKATTQCMTVAWDTGGKRKGEMMQRKVIYIKTLASNQLSLLYLEHSSWLLTMFRITKLKEKLVYLAFGAFLPPATYKPVTIWPINCSVLCTFRGMIEDTLPMNKLFVLHSHQQNIVNGCCSVWL